MDILVDSNVISDIATEDESWFEWSSETLANYAETHTLVINPINRTRLVRAPRFRNPQTKGGRDGNRLER
jgi:hypothetical protein